jgi:hypothetical protein
MPALGTTSSADRTCGRMAQHRLHRPVSRDISLGPGHLIAKLPQVNNDSTITKLHHARPYLATPHLTPSSLRLRFSICPNRRTIAASQCRSLRASPRQSARNSRKHGLRFKHDGRARRSLGRRLRSVCACHAIKVHGLLGHVVPSVHGEL